MDETTYLLSDKNRAIRLVKAIKNVRSNTNVKHLTFKDLDNLRKNITLAESPLVIL
jgi:hypothetical protein